MSVRLRGSVNVVMIRSFSSCRIRCTSARENPASPRQHFVPGVDALSEFVQNILLRTAGHLLPLQPGSRAALALQVAIWIAERVSDGICGVSGIGLISSVANLCGFAGPYCTWREPEDRQVVRAPRPDRCLAVPVRSTYDAASEKDVHSGKR